MTNLIGQGGFGCVYYPELTCEGKPTKNNKYVSKLQIHSSEVSKELKIGKLIRTIPYYSIHFGGITSSCEVDIAKFDKDSILKDCEVVNKHPDEKYILSKLDYIPGEELKDYFLNIMSDTTYLFITLNSYYFLINSLQILNTYEICHYDIKFENIIYNIKKKIPIIIDFGLSWMFSEIQNFKTIKDLKSIFYTYTPTYYIWCPEIQIISLLVNHNFDNNTLLKKELLFNILNQIIDGMGIWGKYTDPFKEEYVKSLHSFYERFIDKDYMYIINELLKYKSTWDTYSINISFLRQYLKKIKKCKNKKIQEFILPIIQFLFKNLSPDPETRLEFSKIKELLYNTFKEDFKSSNSNNYLTYNFSTSNYIFYKKEIIPYLNFFTN